jgi:hypothetical protein
MEYQLDMPEAIDFIAPEQNLETEPRLEMVLYQMSDLADRKFPIRKYNEFTEEYVTSGEQSYEDALRDAYEELEHALDYIVSRIRDNSEISAERISALQLQVEYFKTLLPE